MKKVDNSADLFSFLFFSFRLTFNYTKKIECFCFQLEVETRMAWQGDSEKGVHSGIVFNSLKSNITQGSPLWELLPLAIALPCSRWKGWWKVESASGAATVYISFNVASKAINPTPVDVEIRNRRLREIGSQRQERLHVVLQLHFLPHQLQNY